MIIAARRFDEAPRVECFADGVWLLRVDAGEGTFVAKEEIYPLTPLLAEAVTAAGAVFGAQGVMGHYADGMVVAAEVAERLQLPLVCVPHSMGVLKMLRLGMDPTDHEALRDPQYNFWIRESFELNALRAANFEIANTPNEPDALSEQYGLAFPHLVMPAGAAQPFFDIAGKPLDHDLLAHYDLQPQRYLLFWGRFSQAKNVEGAVRVLGEARRLSPERTHDLRLVLIGGSLENLSAEERLVEDRIEHEMTRYGLTKSDVLRIESLTHDRLAPLARGALAYLGMQLLEPFGMGAAEAMGSGLPTLISNRAGICKWLSDNTHAIFVDPDDPAKAAKRLLELVDDSQLWDRLSRQGREKALTDFSSGGIAMRQGKIFDDLLLGRDPRGAKATDTDRLERRTGRANHRITPAWRGDIPDIKPHHLDAALALNAELLSRIQGARAQGKRLCIAIGGESGSGKSEIAHLLTLTLRREQIRCVVLAGDAFFRLPPAENHAQRLIAYRDGTLADRIGPGEVDLEQLDRILCIAESRQTDRVSIPSDCRAIPGRRYTDVPVDLAGIDAIFIDLTYSLLLEHAACKIFLQRSVLEQIDQVRQRNLERDPDQDFGFIQRVLEIEHEVIAPLQQHADLVVDRDYQLCEL